MKSWIKITTVVILALLLLGTLIMLARAEENCSGESCDLNISADNLVANPIYAPEEETCNKQLDNLLIEYNDLVEDYHSGANCGTIRYMLIDNNAKLTDNFGKCKEELGAQTSYKIPFYITFALLIIAGIYLIYLGSKK